MNDATLAMLVVSIVLVATCLFTMWYVTRPPEKNEWINGTKDDDE